jgi:SAM-dependent MidA family methyltransferase
VLTLLLVGVFINRGISMTNVLSSLIADRITDRSAQRVTFAEFMNWALYEPEIGYYNQRAQAIGASGDFFTAPHLGPDLGAMLAQQFSQMWQILGHPRPFTLVEMGAGQGLLAQDILTCLQQRHSDCFAALEYIIVEIAPGLITRQQQQLQSQFAGVIPLRWQTLESLSDRPITGCYFSNELVDALPVHLVEFVQGDLQEVYVTPEFTEVLGSVSTPQIPQYFASLAPRPTGSGYPDRYRTEVNLAAQKWLGAVTQGLERGYILTIDYGYPADRYYNRVRSEGTLQCYYRHSHHSDPYINIGQQDITAHVNFTALERHGESLGLSNLGLTQQAMFLMALGLADRIAPLGQSASSDPQEIMDRLRRRDALHQLINPMGLGKFGVLLQTKGLSTAEADQVLQGLDQPISIGWLG